MLKWSILKWTANYDSDGDENVNRIQKVNEQNNGSARASWFLLDFFAVFFRKQQRPKYFGEREPPWLFSCVVLEMNAVGAILDR